MSFTHAGANLFSPSQYQSCRPLTTGGRPVSDCLASGKTRDPDCQVIKPDMSHIANPPIGLEREECCTIYPPPTMPRKYTKF